MSIEEVTRLIPQARHAASVLAVADEGVKNAALHAIADEIEKAREILLAANKKDLDEACAGALGAAMLDRLELDRDRVADMVEGLRQLAALPDPVGKISDVCRRPSGIRVGTMRVPIGVIGMIYEARPNVTADASGLCLKSGNSVILRGGSEALRSNCAIADCIDRGLAVSGLPTYCVQLIRTRDREAVAEMLRADGHIDLIIPRGGKSLIERISRDSRIPVIKHLDGICHVYVDRDADPDKAAAISVNAKTHRYGVCNAMETLLVDSAVAEEFLPRIAEALESEGVELRVCERSRGIVPRKPAVEQDWKTEYLAPILSIKIVSGIDEAIEHIQRYGSHHTDAIVTENEEKAMRFMREVDSSSVMVNASTRFADGAEYGLGAEIGISTDKLHVRGPVGLEGLTTRKYVVFGEGHVRE